MGVYALASTNENKVLGILMKQNLNRRLPYPYFSKKRAGLILHLEKASVVKNLNRPDECATRTSDNIIIHKT